MDEIPCDNFWGDPSKSDDKSCAYTTSNLLEVASDDSFTHAADKGESFELSGSGKMHWVRYGTGDTWTYTVMPSGNEQSLECDNDYFGFDPVKGSDKVCQYSDGAYYTLSDGETLDECATEGQSCNPGASRIRGAPRSPVRATSAPARAAFASRRWAADRARA